MTSRRLFIGSMLTLAAVPLLSSGQACCAADKDAKKTAAPTTPSKFKAASAVVGESNEKKTKIKIKCIKCGHLCDETEIDTPTADKPYTLEWTCPKCGKKQTVKVEVAKPE